MRFKGSNILILILLIFFLSCNSGQREGVSGDVIMNSNSASGNVDASIIPAFEFKETEHDFGKIIEGETVAFNFKFKNTGKTDLVISDVSSSCGCTVPDYPKAPIRAGEEGIIKVTFNSSGRHGYQTKNVVIVANTQPNATVLKIKAQVVTAGSQK